MGRLLKLEWLKIRRYRAFMVLVALGVASVVGINYLVYGVTGAAGSTVEMNGADMTEMLVGRPFDFPAVWQTVSYLSGFLLCVSGLVVILLMANEYTFRTARQNVIDGLSRGQFIGTKIALVFVIALGLTVVVFLTGLLFGFSGSGGFSLDGARYLGYFFVQALSHMSVAMVVAMLLKRSGVAIGIYLLYVFIVENVVGMVLNNKVADGVGDFLPIRSAEELVPMPGRMGELANEMTGGSAEIAGGYFLLAAAVWIAACLAFCKYRFERNDL